MGRHTYLKPRKKPFHRCSVPRATNVGPGRTRTVDRHEKHKQGVGYPSPMPTSDNLISLKQAKAWGKRVRREAKRESWRAFLRSINSRTDIQKVGHEYVNSKDLKHTAYPGLYNRGHTE